MVLYIMGNCLLWQLQLREWVYQKEGREWNRIADRQNGSPVNENGDCEDQMANDSEYYTIAAVIQWNF
jgi:hypothetical protein